MKRNNKLLIIAPYQFGELTDCYYWAKYATIHDRNVTYIGYRYKNRDIKERKLDNVKVIGVKYNNNHLILGILFYFTVIWEILYNRHYNIIICRMPYCEIVPCLFKKRNVILDVRTLSVSLNAEQRHSSDLKLINLKRHFKKCTVISEGVGRIIGTPYTILPLGSETISLKRKEFKDIRLLYIGTFDNRKLDVFIRGLIMFGEKTGMDWSFDIIGGGKSETVNELKSIVNTKYKDRIVFHGYMTHDEVVPLFDKCNIGVCFVPITDFYQYQPSTKIFEYLLSGMACIATATYSNCESINENNGVLVDDTEESVANGLIKLTSLMFSFDSESIRDSAVCYHWDNIYKNYLDSILF